MTALGMDIGGKRVKAGVVDESSAARGRSDVILLTLGTAAGGAAALVFPELSTPTRPAHSG